LTKKVQRAVNCHFHYPLGMQMGNWENEAFSYSLWLWMIYLYHKRKGVLGLGLYFSNP
jgi:hypothetical protein